MDVIKKLGPVELTRCAALLPVGGDQAQGPRGHLRAVGLQPLRQAALQPLLQDLHREGVGRPDHRDPRRVGGAADQGPVVLQRRQVGLLRQQGQQDQVADLRVQLPALRPGPDVGADDRRHPRARRRGAAERAGHAAGRIDGRRPRRRGRRRRRDADAVARDLLAAAAHDGRDRRARGARSRCATPRAACATASSSPCCS